ncbi:MAG: nodulation protein NfeD [Acidobacteria bacterium]|nr:nodulation protein NfeD [Acidobacteriota bacterium]
MLGLFLFLVPLAPCIFGQNKIIAVSVDSAVHPITAEIITHGIEQAQRERAVALLIRLNTPGGLLEATRQTVEKIIASPVPVVTFVTPSGGRAASAGFFLLQAGDVAAMASGTHTGAATPIALSQPMDPILQRKMESDTAAMLRSLTERRHRNSQAAEKAIREAQSFTDQEALKQGLIDLICADEPSLIAALNGREITRFDGRKQVLHTPGAQLEDYRLSMRERVISSIADPNLAFLMVFFGAILLYVEFTVPGLIGPGVAGAILILLGLLSLSVLPINWVAVALLVLAVALFVLEAKLASHGVLGAGGAVAMLLGAVMLVEGPPEFRIRWSTAVAVTIPFALITVFLVSLVIRARAQPVATGDAGLLHEKGIAYTDLAPAGKVYIHGEYWDAVAPGPVARGVRVRVAAVEGLRLRVEPAP